MAQPTAYEQYFLELVNRARTDPAGEAARFGIGLNDGLSAGTISSTAKAPLAFNAALLDAADSHSAWMLATDTFSHTGANGSSPTDRMKAAGYQFSGSWASGENIAIRWGNGMTLNQATTEALHEQLFESAGHRANILSTNFREIGIGLAQGEYKGSTGVDVTQDFARSGSSLFLLGVAFDDKDGDHFYDPGEGLGGVSLTITGSTGTQWSTTTWDAGGYQLALPAGQYQVTFSGGGLASPVTRTASIGTSNAKLDLDIDAGTTAPPPPPPPAPGGQTLTGTENRDRLTGGSGADTLNGLGANDTLSGGAGDDTLLGGGGADQVFGNDGNDRLVGGSGADVLAGGAGADIFVFASLDERGDRITDFNAAAGDQLDVAAFLGQAGDGYTDLAAGGFVRLVQYSSGVQVRVDADGGGNSYTTLVTLQGATVAGLGTDFLIA